MTGSIKKLMNGFGFISVEGEPKDFFFHANNLNGVRFEALNEGDAVDFEVGQSPKGPQAENVRPA
jgi:CspA family cold shock protein